MTRMRSVELKIGMPLGDRIKTMAAKWMTPGEPPGPEPGSAQQAMANDGLGHVVGAAGHEPAAACKPL